MDQLQGGGAASASDEPFPWHLGIHDAHCHPTDSLSSVASLGHMSARTLTAMATRSQDQHLVDQLAASQAPAARADMRRGGPPCAVVPAFGWHPWFSHLLYDDAAPQPSYDRTAQQRAGGAAVDVDDEHRGTSPARAAHYQAVLAPPPSDPDFLASLPAPVALSDFIAATRRRLLSHPVALIGEIGIDKAFLLPSQWNPSAAAARDEGLTPGGREGRRLSPHRVIVSHQQAVLRAQLRLAGELGRAVSVHGVRAHGVLFDTVRECWRGHDRKVPSRRQRRMAARGTAEHRGAGSGMDGRDDEDDDDGRGKPFPPRICLHSFSGSVEVLGEWLHRSIPARIFFSFSAVVNLGSEGSRSRARDVLAVVPDDRLLIESDLHVAGEEMDAALERMCRLVCEIKGWTLEEGVRRLGRNYEEFVFGPDRGAARRPDDHL